MTQTGEQVIAEVREKCGPQTMLSFSRGKDAIATYIAIRDHFETIVPYFLYHVPGLEFVEESLAYYEKVIGRHIIRLPHPRMYEWLNEGLFQTPSNMSVIAGAELPKFDYLDIHRFIKDMEGLPEKTLVASGVRAADSPMRRIAIKKHGAISWNRGQYYPVWDWNKERLISEIEQAQIALPIDYEIFDRSFDGLDARFLIPMREHLPRDYQKILEWYPLAEMEVWRHKKIAA